MSGGPPEGDPSESHAIRVRGIYTTALTRRLLDAGHEVVQASGPIRRRFDAEFESAPHDVTVETTGDRQGVGLDGDPAAVRAVTDLLREVAIDTVAWSDDAPRGAVFDGRVTDTLGSGARVSLGDGTGFLPYRNSDDHVEEGDAVRVQVAESAPPWGDDDPLLDTDLGVGGGLATLVPGEGVRVDTRDDAAGRELVGMTDLLPVDVPEGWGIRWSHAATEADMSALEASLSRAVERVDSLSSLPADVDPERRLAAPEATTWVWFGRESRFALDAARRAVTTTMPGHHRTKAASSSASAGVDLAEALCDFGGARGGEADGGNSGGDDDFPFAVVADQFGPSEGDTLSLGHGKPDGRCFSLGEGEVVERGDDGTVAVRRELSGGGVYDALGTPIESGDTAHTKLREGRWWYPTVYRSADGDVKGTYVNVCTPVEVFPREARYVDLHVDVVKHADGTVERVDDDELDAAVEAGHLSAELAEKARSVAKSIESAL